MTAAPTTTRGLELRGEEREVALGEVAAVLAVTRDDDRRRAVRLLHVSVERGDVHPEEQATLESIVALGLQSGRIRARYGPGGEAAAIRLYRKLPGGRELTESANAVTDALHALVGKTIEGVSLGAIAPGAFTLQLATEGAELTIRLDASGARLQSVGV